MYKHKMKSGRVGLYRAAASSARSLTHSLAAPSLYHNYMRSKSFHEGRLLRLRMKGVRSAFALCTKFEVDGGRVRKPSAADYINALRIIN